jgi:hypothetical protein
MVGLRHRIDALTALIPDGLTTRTQIAMFALSVQMHGMAQVFRLHSPHLDTDGTAAMEAANHLASLSDALLDGIDI